MPQGKKPGERAAELETGIASLVREIYGGAFGGFSKLPNPFGLDLRFRVDPQDHWRVTGTESLIEQIQRIVTELGSASDCFRNGRVYCYHCDSNECEHATPPRPKAVFSGFSASGLPQWSDLAQWLVDGQDERAYLLFEPRPVVLAMVTLGRDLKKEQLHLYGKASKSYDILGQVASGYFEEAGGPREDRRFALTSQVVESRGPHGEPRLELNVLGSLPCGTDPMDYLDEVCSEEMRNAFLAAEMQIEEIQSKLWSPRGALSQKDKSRFMRGVPRILKDLAAHIERYGRLSSRRTHHAGQRSREHRPVFKAIDDARGSSMDRILWDPSRETVVVLGHKNRVHVFSPTGELVTSLTLAKTSVARRLRRGRWITAPSEIRDQFLGALGSDARDPAS